ncbi:MAG: GNAT family N-acetyltransferase [Woeseia sp.]
MQVLETDRLSLRHFGIEDAEFVLQLLNEPSFIQHIGDKGVRTVEDAKRYLLSGPLDSYVSFGYGLYMVELKDTGEPVGMCGLVRRENLDDADIGYAFLERNRSKGYALESAEAVMKHARETLGLERIVAIVTPGNSNSIRLLEKIGLTFERMIRLTDEGEELKFFVSDTT